MTTPFLLTIAIFSIVFLILAGLLGAYLFKNWREYLALQRRQAKTLQESEQRYAELFNKVTDIVFIHSLDGIIEEINHTVTKELGYTADEVVGKSMLEFVPPENNPLLGNYLEGVQRLGEFSGLMEIRCKNGQIKVFDYRNSLVIENGKPVAVRGIARNVTEQVRARKALQESEERYRIFFEQDITGDFIATVEGNILSCNSAFARIFGFATTDEAMAQNLSAFFDSPESFGNFLDDVALNGELTYHEDQRIDCNGNTVYVIENIIGIFDDDKNLTGIRGYIFDNTERKHLETQLLHFQKMQGIGTLAGGVAHDFNNILGIIKGYATLLSTGETQTPEDIENSVQAVHQAVDRGAQLVDQILTFARRADIDFVSVDVNAVIRDIVGLVSGTFPRTIDFALDFAEALPPIRADQGQIHQALLNLFINARDAMPQGGVITVTTALAVKESVQKSFPEAQPVDHVRITVADTGVGMDEETRSRLFEPFYTTKERDQGTGLGLSVVYGIVTSHYGQVNVQSETGKGTAFHFYFPETTETVEATSEKPASEGPVTGSETILIVEDEDMLVDLLRATFEDSGYATLVARDGIEAVEMYQHHQKNIDLVFSDSGLPRLSGMDAFHRIRKINPGVRFIFASGYFEPDVKSKMLAEGIESFVQKPYSPIEILKRVRETLDL